MLFISIVFNNY